jgi:hypothetical protein
MSCTSWTTSSSGVVMILISVRVSSSPSPLRLFSPLLSSPLARDSWSREVTLAIAELRLVSTSRLPGSVRVDLSPD